MKLNRTQKYTIQIVQAIASCADEESDYYIGEPLTNDNVTDFCTALLCTCMVTFNKITGEENDLLDTIAMMNKLAFQYSKSEDDDDK